MYVYIYIYIYRERERVLYFGNKDMFHTVN